jgi:DnaJ-domain-containing protein 1
MTTMGQTRSTSNDLCACGCGASVKPGQRWREPACKARAYRARQREAREEDVAAPWAYVEEIEDERRHLFRQTMELGRKLEALEQAYSELWEQHQDCQSAPLYVAPEGPGGGDAYAVLGVRADAEPEAIEGAYHALAKKYHPDQHPGDPVADARIKEINAAHAEVLRLRARRRKPR